MFILFLHAVVVRDMLDDYLSACRGLGGGRGGWWLRSSCALTGQVYFSGRLRLPMVAMHLLPVGPSSRFVPLVALHCMHLDIRMLVERTAHAY